MQDKTMMRNSLRVCAVGVVLLVLLGGVGGVVLADGCSGIIATGRVVSDGRSLLTKNRHLRENNQIPIFGQGTYSYWGIGDGVNSFCRMGINEKGLAIANFDPPPGDLIDDGIWQYTSDRSSPSEDDDMRTVLGEFSTVEDAAMWLAHHASYPCQWGIISQQSGIAAIVAMDANYHSHISYIYEGWVPIGNVWYCENASSANNRRIEYLIGEHLNSSKTLDIRDVVRLLGRDIKASDSEESEPVGYDGTYPVGGLTPSSCRSAVAFLSGDDRFDGALSMAWVAIGQTTHLCPFFPLGASYLKTADDIPRNWTAGLGVEQYTAVKQAYAEESADIYLRSRVQEIHNYTLVIQEEIFERYERVMNSIQNTMSKEDVIEKMQLYANSSFEEGLLAYSEERPMRQESVEEEQLVVPLSLLVMVIVFIVCFAVVFVVYLLSKK